MFKVSQSNSVPASTELPNFRLKCDETDYIVTFSPFFLDLMIFDFSAKGGVLQNILSPPPLGGN